MVVAEAPRPLWSVGREGGMEAMKGTAVVTTLEDEATKALKWRMTKGQCPDYGGGG